MSQTISGSYTGGVTLSGNPATIATGNTISGTTSAATGVYGPTGTAWTLTNQGLVSETGAYSYGISFAASGTIINTGSGTITGDKSGIQLAGGGSVTNQSGGTISGYDGITALNGPATILNAGAIAGAYTSNGTKAAGIQLADGGWVTNQSGGTISGSYGITALNGPATILNAGVIAGAYTTNNNSADGIYLQAGGSVTNQASGNIYGRNDGVLITGASGTVLNLGRIHSHLSNNYGGQGISLDSGGVVVNGGPGGTVSAAYIGGYNGGIVFGATGTDTVVNYGTVSGLPGAVAISLVTGTVVNGASGATGALIEGGGQNNAVLIGGIGTVANYGSIVALEFSGQPSVSYGVSVGGSGTVASFISNLGPSALIAGSVAVYAAQNATVTNGGTLEVTQLSSGNPYAAVIFGGGTNRLIIDPGAVFIGNVYGSGPVTLASGANTTVAGTANGIGTTTMELASAATAGALSGLGTQFVDFAAVTIDAGARWTFSGANTLAAGVTLTDSGTLSDSGTLTNGGLITGAATGVVLTAAARLTNQSGGMIAGSSTGVSASGAATLVNAGVIGGNPTIAGGSGVSLAAGGSVTNQNGATINGYYGIWSKTAATTVVNAGTIAGNFAVDQHTVAGAGIKLASGGRVTNQSGGAISGYYGIEGRGVTVTVVNAGIIAGYASGNPPAGILLSLTGSGSVTNQSGGLISGFSAIEALSGALTVVNAGTIIGGSDAVKFAAGVANRLVIDPNAVFSGTVTGGNTIGAGHVSTLELASAGSAGTLAGLGTQFVDFAQVTVDAGARWTLQATDTIEAGVTLANAGSLSGGVTLAAGGVLSNVATGTIAASSGPAVFGAASGAATVVNAGVIADANGVAGIGVNLTGGGVITNRSGGVIRGTYAIKDLTGATTVVNAGTIAGTLYAVKFAAGVANRLVVDPNAVFSGAIYGGGGVLELASAASAGVLSGLGAAITNFGSLQFDTRAAWTIAGNDAAGGLGTLGIAGFSFGDTIDLTGFAAVSQSFASNSLVLTDAGGAQATLAIQGNFSTGGFGLADDGNGGTDVTVVCFCADTRIGTPDGEVPVQRLQPGDMVATDHNGPRKVVWVGKGKVLATHGSRSAATPVIVRKGALADNVPNRDLHVTKAHSLYVDDVLIPVEFLVNHRTILWDDRAREVEIYHVELESHDVLLANGAPAESYRDDGNRWLFQNRNTGWELPPQKPYRPVLTGGPVVDAVWRRLIDRSGPRRLPPMTDDPDLHLVVDGARVDAQEQHGLVYAFRLPPGAKRVFIASREAVPAEFGTARDPRSLGVALRRMTIQQGHKFMLLDADDDRLTAGFHDYEPDDRLRWTDGYAELPIAMFAQFDEGGKATLYLGGATRYPDDGDRVAA